MSHASALVRESRPFFCLPKAFVHSCFLQLANVVLYTFMIINHKEEMISSLQSSVSIYRCTARAIFSNHFPEKISHALGAKKISLFAIKKNRRGGSWSLLCCSLSIKFFEPSKWFTWRQIWPWQNWREKKISRLQSLPTILTSYSPWSFKTKLQIF